MLKVYCSLTICLAKWQLQKSTMLTYVANCLSLLKRSAEESWPRYPYFCMTMHLLTGHVLKKPLYLNADLKKCAIHHTLLTRHNDYHLFPNLKKHLHRQRFVITDDELKYAGKEWLKGQSELFYFTGIKKIRVCYKLCIDKGVLISSWP